MGITRWGLEYGEDPHQALVRELKEETGLDIEIIKPVYTFTAIRPHYQTVGIGFLCIPTNDQVKISFEHTDYKFVDEDELEKTLDPHIFNDIKKTIEEYNQIREYNELKEKRINASLISYRFFNFTDIHCMEIFIRIVLIHKRFI